MKSQPKSKPFIVCSGGRVPVGLIPMVIAATLGQICSSLAQTPAVAGVNYHKRSGMEPPVVGMEVVAPPLSRLTVMHTPNLFTPWRPFAPPVVALDNLTPLAVPLQEELGGSGFFRIEVAPPRVSARFVGGEIEVNVLEEGVSLDEILIGLYRLRGVMPHCAPDYQVSDEETTNSQLLPAVQKGSYRGNDLPALGASMSCRFWDAIPLKDDEGLAAAYVPPRSDQGKPVDLPGDGGTGRIEDGWQGDAIKTEVRRTTTLPPPGSFDMKYTPEVSGDSKDDQIGEVDLKPGSHVRLRLSFDGKTFKILSARKQDTGDGVLDKPFNIPGKGAFIIAVLNANQQIVHLLPFEDPRIERAYEPPAGGSHGHQLAGDGSVRLTLPVPGRDFTSDLSQLTVRILGVKGMPGGTARLLTPAIVTRNSDLFPVAASFSGSEVQSLLGARLRTPRAATRAPDVTTLHRSGSNGSKFNVAIMGDGFRDTPADQALFNNYAQDVILDTLQKRDIHPSVLNGMNVFRVNTYSQESGITTVNGSGVVTSTKSTALEYRFSGNWNRCWMEPGPNSQALIDAAVDSVCPQADFVVLLLNTTGFGGCAGGNRFTVTRGAGWNVVAHEFGHRPGTLGDEYTCGAPCGCYGGGEPGVPNLTANTTRASLKWNVWVPSWRPLPTSAANIADSSQDTGLFPGATIGNGQWSSCIFRPSRVGRMNDNTPPHNPPGYTNVREQFRPYQLADLRRRVTGDFNGDGKTDLVLLDDRQLALYTAGERDVGPNDPVSGSPPRSITGVLQPRWYNTDMIRNAAQTRSWQVRSTDTLVSGDFDNDGLDDLYIINLSAWDRPYVGLLKSFGDHFEPVARYDANLPGWEMRGGDEFFAADFNGDGRDDLMVYNGTNWSIPYFGMLRSTGAGLAMSRRYDKFLPGWEMGRHEKFLTGDFNKDGRRDVVSFNTQSWAQVHLMIFTSTGPELSLQDRYYGTIPGFWQLRRNDQLHVLDFDGDGDSDLVLFNGLDWGPVYLGYLGNQAGKISGRRRYDNTTSPLPGWQLQRRDVFFPANVDGDTDQDLVVYNKDNWSTQYLGMLKSNSGETGGFSVTGSWQDDWINGWNLGPDDQFSVAEFRGSGGWSDLYVCNAGWFGLLRGYQTHFRLEAIYRKWIHNHRYHGYGWW